MKNIVTVKRIKDNANRVYGLPEGVHLEAGTLVKFPDAYGKDQLGFTTQKSIDVEDAVVCYMTNRQLVTITAYFTETTIDGADDDTNADDNSDDTEESEDEN